MRSTVNHTPPTTMQPEPADNTSAHVYRQVHTWSEQGGVPIHTQSAMEIAAWHQSPDNSFAAFASTGTIESGLLDDIAAEVASYNDITKPDDRDRYLNVQDAMRALDAYVRACTQPTTYLLDLIMAYEQDDLDDATTIELFQLLVNNGMAWTLQGHYGRTAKAMLDAGQIEPAE
jgi:hypothetical protein